MKIRKDISNLIKKAYRFIAYRVIPSKIFIRWKFNNIFGYKIDIINAKTFNEKLQWRKFYDRKEIYSICSDKYQVKEYVKQKISDKYLIPLICSLENPEDLRVVWEKFPEKFVIKSNHGSGQIRIVTNKKDINLDELIETCKNWLKINYYYFGKEYQYKNIKPRIIVENLLMTSKGKVPEDYKFHCFNGKVEFIQVDTDRFGDHKRSFFDKKWKLLPFTLCEKINNRPIYKINRITPKPINLNKMISLSETLSLDFDYVRVDLYNLKGKIYFGELTFNHGSGFESFFPDKYDAIYGNKIKTNKK